MNFQVDETDDSIIYSTTSKILTQIAREQDKMVLKAIEEFCEENGYIPNIIDADKLELIIKLGIQEYMKREMEKNK